MPRNESEAALRNLTLSLAILCLASPSLAVERTVPVRTLSLRLVGTDHGEKPRVVELGEFRSREKGAPSRFAIRAHPKEKWRKIPRAEAWPLWKEAFDPKRGLANLKNTQVNGCPSTLNVTASSPAVKTSICLDRSTASSRPWAWFNYLRSIARRH